MKNNKDKVVSEPKFEYYTIELEAMVPATLKYRILATSPEEAFAGLLKASPIQTPKLTFASMKKVSAKVFNYGTRILKYSKRF